MKKIFEENITVGGLPATRSSYEDEDGNQVQIVDDGGKTLIVSALPAGGEFSTIKIFPRDQIKIDG